MRWLRLLGAELRQTGIYLAERGVAILPGMLVGILNGQAVPDLEVVLFPTTANVNSRPLK
jgi:hypothetical protein